MTVDLYLYSSHEVAVWEPIWRALRQRGVDAQFVLEPPGVHAAMGSVPNPNANWFDDKDGDIEPLMNPSTFSILTELLAERSIASIPESRLSADAVITTQGVGWLLRYHDALRIKTEYGASAFVGAHGHGSVNAGLDAVLAHGNFAACAISAHLPSDQIHIVGYPKWAPSLREGLTREDAREILDIDSSLPVLAWLPTWAHNSGIDRYSTALAELADDYLIIAKPHHNSLRFESTRLAEIDERIVVRSDLHSLVPLYMAADVVVADSRSGALAETLLADRPVVGLLPGIDARSNGVFEGLDEVAVWCQQPEDLISALTNALGTDRSASRSRWRQWLFADHGGRDDHVAAETIIRLISDRVRPGSSSLPLEALDQSIDDALENSAGSTFEVFGYAWQRWPGHPRLLDLLAQTCRSFSPAELLASARLVRSQGFGDACPLLAVMNDREVEPLIRMTASALAAIELEDQQASEQFHSLVEQVAGDRFDEAFYQLDMVPAALPVFVHAAATTPDRCRELAASLNRLGAEDEANSLRAYGETLVAR